MNDSPLNIRVTRDITEEAFYHTLARHPESAIQWGVLKYPGRKAVRRTVKMTVGCIERENNYTGWIGAATICKIGGV